MDITRFATKLFIYFHEKYFLLYTVPLDSCTVATSQILERVPPERATYTQLIKPLKIHISCLDYPNVHKLLLLGF